VDTTTLPYAGFPTDAQAQMMLMASPGISIITERIFGSRFMHVSELTRLGAGIEIEVERNCEGRQTAERRTGYDQRSRIRGWSSPASRLAEKHRSAACTTWTAVRGIDAKLRKLGARIERIERHEPTDIFVLLALVGGWGVYRFWAGSQERKPRKKGNGSKLVSPGTCPECLPISAVTGGGHPAGIARVAQLAQHPPARAPRSAPCVDRAGLLHHVGAGKSCRGPARVREGATTRHPFLARLAANPGVETQL
jgi:hypothetical protein